jgi:acyl carrier protein
MKREEIIAQINQTIADNFELDVKNLKPETLIIDDLKLDSLDAVDMLVHLEEKINLKISIEKLKDARTLGDLYNLVEETVNGAPVA